MPPSEAWLPFRRVEITSAGERTRLLYTEQAVYLDGLDTPADREKGTREEFKKLDAARAN